MKEPMEEDVEEADKEMDVEEVPLTGELAPEEAQVLPATLLVVSGIWAGGPGGQVAG